MLRALVARRVLPVAVVTTVLAMPLPAGASAVVRTLIVGREAQSVPVTDRVHLSRFADLAEQQTISVGTELQVGDLFWTPPGGTDVLLEISCPAGGATVFRFSGAFRVVVLPPRPDVPCVLQLLGGGVDVRAEEPTEINAGGIVLGSKGTQYSVRLRREGRAAVCEGAVYDDDLTIGAPSRAIKLPQNASWIYNFVTSEGRSAPIADDLIKQTAEIATRFDVARLFTAKAAAAPEIQRTAQELFDLHVSVLKAPANREARVKLGTAQQRLGITDGAQYNLKRAERIRLEQSRVNNVTEKPAEPPAAATAAAAAQAQPASKTATAAAKRPVGAPAAPARSAEVLAARQPSERALELVRAGRPVEAVDLLKPVVDGGKATTRDYYALAEAYHATQDRPAARKAAEQALAAADAASVLTPSEMDSLRVIARDGH